MFGNRKRIDALVRSMNQLSARQRAERRRSEGRERTLQLKIARLESAIDILKAIVSAQSQAAAASVHAIPDHGEDLDEPTGHALEDLQDRMREEQDSPSPEVLEARKEWSTGFQRRLDEIWGGGISVDEMVRRQHVWRQENGLDNLNPEPTPSGESE